MSGSISEAEAIEQRIVRVKLCDLGAVIPANVAGIVAQALSPRSPAARKRQGGLRFFRSGRKGRLLVPRGLLSRAMSAIDQFGYQVELIDRRVFAKVPSVDLHEQNPPSIPLLIAISTAVRDVVSAGVICGGAIAIRSHTMLPDVIATIISLFPREKVLVIVKNELAAINMTQRLRTVVTLPVSANTDYQYQDGPLIHVDNMHSCTSRSVTDFRVVIIADLESARAATVNELVQCMDQSCVFAIIPASARLDGEDQLRLEMLCGPEIYRQLDDASALTHVQVSWIEPSGYAAEQPSGPLQRKRLCFAANLRRNQCLAEVAIASRSLNVEKLRRFSLASCQLLKSSCERQHLPSVCVLVESSEHARTLAKLLPGWRQYSGVPDPANTDVTGIPLMDEQAIVTIPRAYAQGLAFDVVIRAAGTEQSWKPAYGPHAVLNGSHMLIIDVADDVDDRARLDTSLRAQDYQQRGWLTAPTAT